jgi:hypothetical protein
MTLIFCAIKLLLYQLFHKQVFSGNSDQQSIVTNSFSPAITARYIRLQPRSWHNQVSMRLEVYGCYTGKRFNIMFVVIIAIVLTTM